MKDLDWIYSKPWKDETTYIIGGGSSLCDFEWSRLHGKHTIGCNDAYKLGVEVCEICIFGDFSWWKHHGESMEEYKGFVVTNVDALNNGLNNKPPWVHFMERLPVGLHKKELGWNGNTGASALNLAIILGATTIYLLGFDIGIRKGKTNWHNDVIHPQAVLPTSYVLFSQKWEGVVTALKSYKNVNVVNLNKHDTIPGIKKMSIKDHWKEV